MKKNEGFTITLTIYQNYIKVLKITSKNMRVVLIFVNCQLNIIKSILWDIIESVSWQ